MFILLHSISYAEITKQKIYNFKYKWIRLLPLVFFFQRLEKIFQKVVKKLLQSLTETSLHWGLLNNYEIKVFCSFLYQKKLLYHCIVYPSMSAGSVAAIN